MKNLNVHIDPKQYKGYPYDYDTRLGSIVCLKNSNGVIF
jgi:hypothetical protein